MLYFFIATFEAINEAIKKSKVVSYLIFDINKKYEN